MLKTNSVHILLQKSHKIAFFMGCNIPIHLSQLPSSCLGIANHQFLWFVDESKYNAIYSSVPSCADFKGLLFVNKAGLILDQRVFILGFYCWSKVCPVENMSHRKHVPSKICPIENMSVENISVEKSPGDHPLCVLLPK